jgi:membrane protein
MTFAQNFFPGSEEVVRRTMDQIIASKGTSFWSWGGIVGFGFLLWSASSVFAGIIQNINQAWHSSPPRHFVLERVLGIAMIFILFVFFGITVFVNTGLKFYFQWLARQSTPHLLLPFQSGTAQLLLWLIPTLFTFVTFLLMYRFIPNTVVLWKEAAWGAIFATIIGELSKSLFVRWYVYNGAASFSGLYGGMSAMTVLMLWLYVYSLIILLGANLSASIAFSERGQAAIGPGIPQ